MSEGGNKTGPVKGWTPALPALASRPATLGDVLVEAHDSMIKRSGVALGHDTWRSIVGERIAARTRVASIAKGLLTIRVASSAWGTELSFLEVDLLKRFTEVGLDVRRLRFQVDADIGPRTPARRPGSWAPRSVAGGSGGTLAPPNRIELPPELLARLAAIEDPALRSSIAEAARSTLAAERKTPEAAGARGAETDPRSGREPRSPRDKRR